MITRASFQSSKKDRLHIASRRLIGKKTWVSVLAVVMSLLLPSTAFAADWEASTWDDMETAFGDTDPTVTILVLNNISNDFYGTLSGNTGSTYTIDGNGYTLTNLALDAGGTVIINNAMVETVSTAGTVNLTVNGDIKGKSGNPDEVDYSDPYGFSDGSAGLETYDSSSVTVNGNVSGGNAYGTGSYAGTGLLSNGNSTVLINGNVSGGTVTGDPNTLADPNSPAIAGAGIVSQATATITVNGNVTGGNTNTDKALAGQSVCVLSTNDGEAQLGTITITGDVIAGTSLTPTGVNAFPLYYVYSGGEPEQPRPFTITPTPPIGDAYWPTVVVYKLILNADGAFFGGTGSLTAGQIAALGAATNYLIYGTSNAGGTVDASSDTALAGETVTLYPHAEPGYELSGIWVNGQLVTPVNGVYFFIMPEGGADITAQFTPISSTTQTNNQTGSALANTGDDAQAVLFFAITLGLLSFLTMATVSHRSNARRARKESAQQ